MSALASVAAVVIDCREAAALAAFYQSVFGGEIIRADRILPGWRGWPDRDLPRRGRPSATDL